MSTSRYGPPQIKIQTAKAFQRPQDLPTRPHPTDTQFREPKILIAPQGHSSNTANCPPWSGSDGVSHPQADIFAFGIVLCELIARVPADPDYLPRTEVRPASAWPLNQEGVGVLLGAGGKLGKADMSPSLFTIRTLAWMCLLSGRWLVRTAHCPSSFWPFTAAV